MLIYSVSGNQGKPPKMPLKTSFFHSHNFTINLDKKLILSNIDL